MFRMIDPKVMCRIEREREKKKKVWGQGERGLAEILRRAW